MHEESRRLQRALLPRNAPSIAGYDIAAGTTLEPAGQGSSLWDWFLLSGQRLALIALEATPGDPLPAHRLGVARAFLREFPRADSGFERSLARVNSAVARTSAPGSGGPIQAGVLLLTGGGLNWFGAGAVQGGVIRRAGTFEAFPSHGPPLGLMDGFTYGRLDVELDTGDVVLVLSGGGRGLLRGAADLVADLHGRPSGDVLGKLQTALQRASGEQNHRERSLLFVRRR